jgi:glucose-1-phosphate cytidylyltransferase
MPLLSRFNRAPAASNIWVNGGYFVLSKDVFRYLRPGEELVYEPMRRMIAEGKVWSRRYEGFWQCMDTFKDKQILDELEATGSAPWFVWKNGLQARLSA